LPILHDKAIGITGAHSPQARQGHVRSFKHPEDTALMRTIVFAAAAVLGAMTLAACSNAESEVAVDDAEATADEAIVETETMAEEPAAAAAAADDAAAEAEDAAEAATAEQIASDEAAAAEQAAADAEAALQAE
jgi:colicin import membrane protein